VKDIWADVNYGYKKKITLENAKVDGDEVDFPVFVGVTDANLADEANGGHVKSASGYDIVFYNSAEDTLLKHEIELYTNTNGKLCFWVKIPSISSTPPSTYIYAYYGKVGVVADPSSTDTWNADYISVYHFVDNTDSTSNAKTLTENNGISYANSELGRGADLNGTDDCFSRASGSGWFTTEDDITVISYVDTPASVSESKKIFKQSSVAASSTLFAIDNTADELKGYVYRSANTVYPGTGNDDVDGDYHLFAYRSVRNDKLYVHKDDDAAVTANELDNVAFSLGTSDRNFVGCDAIGSQTWEGIIDEVQLIGADVGANWITTSYNSMSDPGNFLTWGAEESQSTDVDVSAGIKVWDGTADIELVKDNTSPVKVFDGTDVIGVKLVATDDGDASAIRIRLDGSTTKAFKKKT